MNNIITHTDNNITLSNEDLNNLLKISKLMTIEDKEDYAIIKFNKPVMIHNDDHMLIHSDSEIVIKSKFLHLNPTSKIENLNKFNIKDYISTINKLAKSKLLNIMNKNKKDCE